MAPVPVFPTFSSSSSLSSPAASSLAQAGPAGAPPAPQPGVPEELQRWLWQGWVAALEPTLAHWSQTPPGTRHALPQPALRHFGTAFKEGALPGQAPENLLRLLRLDLSVGLEVLELFTLDASNETWYPVLVGVCNRIGQVYSELARRFGAFFALSLLRRELKRLGQRTGANYRL